MKIIPSISSNFDESSLKPFTTTHTHSHTHTHMHTKFYVYEEREWIVTVVYFIKPGMVIAYSRNLCATLEAVFTNIKTYSGYARAMLQMREHVSVSM